MQWCGWCRFEWNDCVGSNYCWRWGNQQCGGQSWYFNNQLGLWQLHFLHLWFHWNPWIRIIHGKCCFFILNHTLGCWLAILSVDCLMIVVCCGTSMSFQCFHVCLTLGTWYTLNCLLVMLLYIDYFVSWCNSWLCHVFMFEEYSVWDFFVCHGLEKDNGTPVMLWGGTKLPTISWVFAPCSSSCWFVMKLHWASHGGKGHSVVIKLAMVIGIDWNIWYHVRWSNKVDC